MKTSLVAVLVLLTTLPAHSAPLKIDCTFTDPEIKDHVRIELTSDQQGSFYYAAQSDGASSTSLEDKLVLKRVASTQADTAVWQAVVDQVQMYFKMPSSLVNKPSDAFKASLLTQIPELNLHSEQALVCSSK